MESDPNFRPVRDWHWRNDARPKNDEERWDLFGRGMGFFYQLAWERGSKLWNQDFKCQLLINSDESGWSLFDHCLVIRSVALPLQTIAPCIVHSYQR